MSVQKVGMKVQQDTDKDRNAKSPGEKKASELLKEARRVLLDAGIEDSVPESFILLEWICGIDRTAYYMEPDATVSERTVQKFYDILGRRIKRIPLQYLMKSCEFMGYSFYVDERVLIPRPDTECLAEEALMRLQYEEKERTAGWKPKVLDVCTGSGCIGLSIKKLYPKAEVTLADISGEALDVARTNARRLGAEVELIQGDLFEKAGKAYDLILSNPPYIPTKVIASLMPEVRDHEPHLALDGSADGLEFYRRITQEAGKYLVSGGWLMLEIGMEQGADLKKLLREKGFINIEIKKDLAGLDRIALGQWQCKTKEVYDV